MSKLMESAERIERAFGKEFEQGIALILREFPGTLTIDAVELTLSVQSTGFIENVCKRILQEAHGEDQIDLRIWARESLIVTGQERLPPEGEEWKGGPWGINP